MGSSPNTIPRAQGRSGVAVRILGFNLGWGLLDKQKYLN